MRKLPYIGIMLLMVTAVGCGRQTDDSARIHARDLYLKSSRLLRAYCDSMAASRDSVSLLNLESRLKESLTRLNFEYPTETDLQISEGENDTLANLTSRYVSLRDSMLYLFAHPISTADSLSSTDSEPNDSTTNQIKK